VSDGDLLEPRPEEAGVGNHDPLARLEEIGDGGIEADGSGPRHHVRWVGRVEQGPQVGEQLVVESDPHISEMGNDRLGEGVEILGGELPRPGDHERGHIR
jgi:hypothetical protein